MGFAGQVFAAKMAVGLAVPSQSALSRTGSMLAKGASGIYGALAAKRKESASKRVAEAQAEVDKLKKISDSASRNASAKIAGHAAQGMYDLEIQGKRTMKAMEKGGADAFSGMKTVMGKEGDALFKGLDKASTPLQKMTNLTKNFSKMSDKQQKRALKQSQEYVKAKKEAVETAKDNVGALVKEREALIKKGKYEGKEQKIIDNKIKAYNRRLQQSRKLRDEAIAEGEIIRTVSVQAWAAENEILEENERTKKSLADATEKLAEEEAALADITNEVTEEAEGFGAAVVDTVNKGVSNFKEILVESIATMTAFYYKLNQNTEAIIEFER